MGGLLLYRLGAAEFGLRVDEFLRAEGASALLALVTISVRIAALRAGTDYVPVSQECLGLGIVVLLALLGDELALVVKLTEELRGVLVMNL